ncbi:MAG: hypothetical protein AB7Y46_06765 [Armatimonadota bacterium]
MYRPRDTHMGDFWFLRGPDGLHMYYLEFAIPARDAFAEEGIGHATSTDGIHWVEQGRVIGRGEPGAWDDAAIFTGSAIEVGGRYYMLYTGLTRADRCQRIGLLTSDDLHHWERFEGNPVLEPDPRWYETLADVDADTWVAWRDPCLYWHEPEGACYAFITATERGDRPRHERGCIGLARSQDMVRWEALPPATAPGLYHDHEVPDLFELGGRWYLLHSTRLWRYSETALERKPARWCRNGTHYLVAPDPLGPWEVPPVDVVAGAMADSLYAARAQRVGDDLLLYAWGPTRRELAVPLKLDAAADGALCALYWEGLDQCRGESLCHPRFAALRGEWQETQRMMLGAADGAAAVAGCEREAIDLSFSAEIVPGIGARAGIGVSDGAQVLAGVIDTQAQETAIVRLPAGTGPAHAEVLSSVPWDVVPVQAVRLRLVCDGEVLELFVDDEFAVAACCEGRGRGAVRLAIEHGTAEFRAMEAHALKL